MEVTYRLHIELVLRGLGCVRVCSKTSELRRFLMRFAPCARPSERSKNPTVELDLEICHPASVDPPPAVNMEHRASVMHNLDDGDDGGGACP